MQDTELNNISREYYNSIPTLEKRQNKSAKKVKSIFNISLASLLLSVIGIIIGVIMVIAGGVTSLNTSNSGGDPTGNVIVAIIGVILIGLSALIASILSLVASIKTLILDCPADLQGTKIGLGVVGIFFGPLFPLIFACIAKKRLKK